MPEKMVDFSKLVKIIAKARKKLKKIVYAHGAFDLLHSGHIHHLEEAKKLGDILVVTVTPDIFIKKGPGRPRFKEIDRMKFLAALECVDYVALTNSPDAVDSIKALSPNFYVKGEDVKEKAERKSEGLFREIEAMKEVCGEVKFIKSLPIHSTELLNEHFSVYPKEVNEFLNKFAKKYPLKTIFDALKEVRKLKVLVIGDAIVDSYQYVSPMGKSPKSNHLVAKILNKEEFAGGVMACANHVASFCDDVTMVTCLGGNNSYQDFIKNNLDKKIKCKFFKRPLASTIIKERFVDPAYLTKIFEVCFIDDSDLSEDISQKIIKSFDSMNMETFDIVLIADYGHGFLTKDIIDYFSSSGKFLALNVQTNSANYGFNLITKYPRADYICIDDQEIHLALHNRNGDLESLIDELQEKMGAEKISITRGHRGCVTYFKNKCLNVFSEIPVLSTKVVDTVGAGDAFFAASSLFTKLDLPMEIVGFIGNVAGAIKVGTLCNKSAVGLEQLKDFIERLLIGRK